MLNLNTWHYSCSVFKDQTVVLCFLHCRVAKASSSLLRITVSWDIGVRLFRAGWSSQWRRSMWNFKWPFRLNLNKHQQLFSTSCVFKSYKETVVIQPLAAKFAGEWFLVGVGHHVSAQVLLVLRGKAAARTLVRTQVGVHPHVSLKKETRWHLCINTCARGILNLNDKGSPCVVLVLIMIKKNSKK